MGDDRVQRSQVGRFDRLALRHVVGRGLIQTLLVVAQLALDVVSRPAPGEDLRVGCAEGREGAIHVVQRCLIGVRSPGHGGLQRGPLDVGRRRGLLRRSKCFGRRHDASLRLLDRLLGGLLDGVQVRRDIGLGRLGGDQTSRRHDAQRIELALPCQRGVNSCLRQPDCEHRCSGPDRRVGRGDGHVDRRVAVEDVDAALADEQVARPTANDDFAFPAPLGLARGDVRLEIAAFHVGNHAEALIAGVQAVDQREAVLRDVATRVPDDRHLVAEVVDGVVGTAKDVAVRRATQTLDPVVAVLVVRARRREDRGHRDAQVEVDFDPVVVVREARPVEAEHALHDVHTGAVDRDVVAVLHVDVGVAVVVDDDVVALVSGLAELLRGAEVALQDLFATSAVLEPVVVGATTVMADIPSVVEEVVTRAAEELGEVVGVHEEVGSPVTEDEVFGPVAGVDRVVAFAALDDVGAGEVGDDVVAGAAFDVIRAVAALDPVVAFAAPDRVVTDATDHGVRSGAASDHDVIAAGVLEERSAVRHGNVRGAEERVTNDQPEESLFGIRVGQQLLVRVDVEVVVGRREEGCRQRAASGLADVAVSHGERREGVRLEAGEHRHRGRSEQVVEAVTILERFQLVLEDEVVGGAEIALEGAALFREATDPEIDLLDTRDREPVLTRRPVTVAAEEVRRIRRDVGRRDGAEARGLAERGIDRHRAHQLASRDSAFFQRARLAFAAVARDAVGPSHVRVGAVRGHEVHEALRMPQVVRVVEPAHIGRQSRVAGRRVELPASAVQRGQTRVATACDIDRCEVERKAHEVVLQSAGHELVDLAADLAGDTAEDRARRLLGRQRVLAGRVVVIAEGRRVQEGLEETELIRCLHRIQRRGVDDGHVVGVVAVDVLGQHRVAEAVDAVGELGGDPGIDRVLVREDESVLERGDRRSELVEDDAVVLHLGAEASCLEDALAVPGEPERFDRLLGGPLIRQGRVTDREREAFPTRQVRGGDRRIGVHPLVDEREITRIQDRSLRHRGETVVLAVEDRVNRGERDVFVAATVTAHEVLAEQLVVVGRLAVDGRARRANAAGV